VLTVTDSFILTAATNIAISNSYLAKKRIRWQKNSHSDDVIMTVMACPLTGHISSIKTLIDSAINTKLSSPVK